jgi:hypothetical protein
MTAPVMRDWQIDGLAGLTSPSAEDLPSFEILYLDSLAAWVLGGVGLELPHTVEHGAKVVAFLLQAMTNASAYAPERTPTPSDAMTLARESVLAGARGFGERGLPGLTQLVNRVISASIGELELHTGAPEEQVRSLFRYGLLAVASGPANELPQAAAEGIDELFVAWDALIGDGFAPPWRSSVTPSTG